MKGIDKYIKESSINEAREIEYRVALADVKDGDGIPITVTILVEKANQKVFEDWAIAEEGFNFIHCDGGNIEY